MVSAFDNFSGLTRQIASQVENMALLCKESKLYEMIAALPELDVTLKHILAAAPLDCGVTVSSFNLIQCGLGEWRKAR